MVAKPLPTTLIHPSRLTEDRLKSESPVTMMRRTKRRGGLLSIAVLAAAAYCAAQADAVSVPGGPARVDLSVLSGDEVLVTFAAPLSDGGSAVQSYEVCAVLWYDSGVDRVVFYCAMPILSPVN